MDKRSQLAIRRIKNQNGSTIEGDEAIGTAAVEFFKSLLAEPSAIDNLASMELLNNILALITPEQNS